jgi:hypothetical protein
VTNAEKLCLQCCNFVQCFAFVNYLTCQAKFDTSLSRWHDNGIILKPLNLISRRPEISLGASFTSFHYLNRFLMKGVLNISDINMAAERDLSMYTNL